MQGQVPWLNHVDTFKVQSFKPTVLSNGVEISTSSSQTWRFAHLKLNIPKGSNKHRGLVGRAVCCSGLSANSRIARNFRTFKRINKFCEVKCLHFYFVKIFELFLVSTLIRTTFFNLKYFPNNISLFLFGHKKNVMLLYVGQCNSSCRSGRHTLAKPTCSNYNSC